MQIKFSFNFNFKCISVDLCGELANCSLRISFYSLQLLVADKFLEDLCHTRHLSFANLSLNVTWSLDLSLPTFKIVATFFSVMTSRQWQTFQNYATIKLKLKLFQISDFFWSWLFWLIWSNQFYYTFLFLAVQLYRSDLV